jgi:hypothetical protein
LNALNEDPPLTERQQQLMAYVDDELSAEQRAAFEVMMSEDPELAIEAAKHRGIMDLSRSMALAEPTDHEIRRFWARFYNRTEWRVGWVMLSGGLVVLAIEGIYLMLATDRLTWLLKGAILSTVLGALILLSHAVRLKLRTSHFDRYRGVVR